MGKADELLRSMGGIIAESASHRRTPAAMPAATATSTLTTDRLAGVSRSKTALEVPLDRIEADPDQPREEFDDDALRRLAESIAARGVLQPIRVRWDEGKGRYIVIVGERRWRASRMAGLATLPCIVDDRLISAGELLAMQMVENCLREDLKPVEQAKAFRALMNLNGWSGNQLAKELGIAQSGVAQTLKLLYLPDMVQAAVDTGELPASTAYEISKVADPVERTELAERIVAERMTRAETASAVKAVNAATKHAGAKGRGATSKAKAKKVTERVFRTAAGPRISVEFKRGLDDEMVRTALTEALGQVEARLSERDQSAA